MLNNVVGYWAYIRGLIFGGLIFGWAYIRGEAYIWNEVSVSICGGLIFGGGAYIRGGGLILRYCRSLATIWHSMNLRLDHLSFLVFPDFTF
jgi:hypothetical protein